MASMQHTHWLTNTAHSCMYMHFFACLSAASQHAPASVCVQVFVLQKALPPASAVLIAALPPTVIVQVPEAVVLVLLAGQALLFGASQLKGLAALLIYNHTACPARGAGRS